MSTVGVKFEDEEPTMVTVTTTEGGDLKSGGPTTKTTTIKKVKKMVKRSGSKITSSKQIGAVGGEGVTTTTTTTTVKGAAGEGDVEEYETRTERYDSTINGGEKNDSLAIEPLNNEEQVDGVDNFVDEKMFCYQCDESLAGHRYILRDEKPYCIKCYEGRFSKNCDQCAKIIGVDSKDLSHKERHWHEACFNCYKCKTSLADKQFGTKADRVYCGDCYDEQFSSRCEACNGVFKAGMKKMEYKNKQWHEKCFTCCQCEKMIGSRPFVPKEDKLFCSNCYDEKFATKCSKCAKVIKNGGVTYRNDPFHRECFTCTGCEKALSNQRFTTRDEKPFCAHCFADNFARRCTACTNPITGKGGLGNVSFVAFEKQAWHNDCFVCKDCNCSLVGKGFHTEASDILCSECIRVRMQAEIDREREMENQQPQEVY